MRRERSFLKSQWFSFSTEEWERLDSASGYANEVAILTFRYTPEVFTTLHSPAIGSLNIFGTTNDGEWHGFAKHACMFNSSFIVCVNGRLVDTNALGFDDFTDLIKWNKMVTLSL